MRLSQLPPLQDSSVAALFAFPLPMQAPTSLHFQFYAKPAEGAAGAAGPAGAAGGLRVIDLPAIDRLPESGEFWRARHGCTLCSCKPCCAHSLVVPLVSMHVSPKPWPVHRASAVAPPAADHQLLERLVKEHDVPADKRFALLHKVGPKCLLPGCVVFLHAPRRTKSAQPPVRVPWALGCCSPWHADGQQCTHTGRPTLPLFSTPHLLSAPIRCPHRSGWRGRLGEAARRGGRCCAPACCPFTWRSSPTPRPQVGRLSPAFCLAVGMGSRCLVIVLGNRSSVRCIWVGCAVHCCEECSTHAPDLRAVQPGWAPQVPAVCRAELLLLCPGSPCRSAAGATCTGQVRFQSACQQRHIATWVRAQRFAGQSSLVLAAVHIGALLFEGRSSSHNPALPVKPKASTERGRVG